MSRPPLLDEDHLPLPIASSTKAERIVRIVFWTLGLVATGLCVILYMGNTRNADNVLQQNVAANVLLAEVVTIYVFVRSIDAITRT